MSTPFITKYSKQRMSTPPTKIKGCLRLLYIYFITKRMSTPFHINLILEEPISKLIIIIIGFIYFMLPTSVEDIRMSTPVFLSTQANNYLS